MYCSSRGGFRLIDRLVVSHSVDDLSYYGKEGKDRLPDDPRGAGKCPPSMPLGSKLETCYFSLLIHCIKGGLL